MPRGCNVRLSDLTFIHAKEGEILRLRGWTHGAINTTQKAGVSIVKTGTPCFLKLWQGIGTFAKVFETYMGRRLHPGNCLS